MIKDSLKILLGFLLMTFPITGAIILAAFSEARDKRRRNR